MTDTTFMDTIDRLTINTHTYIERDDGKHLVTRTGLLPQLREAVAIGLEGGGGSASFGPRPTIAPGARDLLTEIERQAAEALKDATKLRLTRHPVEAHVRLWAATVNEHTMVTVRTSQQHPDELVDKWRREHNPADAVYFKIDFLPARAVAQRWFEQIDSFFNPPDTMEIPGACPSCEATHTHRLREGQTVRATAMSFLREDSKAVEARCGACGTKWFPYQFEWLARTLGATPLPELELQQMQRGDNE